MMYEANIHIFPKLDAPRKICNPAQVAQVPQTESVRGGKAILGTAKTEASTDSEYTSSTSSATHQH